MTNSVNDAPHGIRLVMEIGRVTYRKDRIGPCAYITQIKSQKYAHGTPQACISLSSVALPCLYALSTGKIKSPDEIKEIGKGDNASHQSLVRACFVAKELLMYPDGRQRKVS